MTGEGKSIYLGEDELAFIDGLVEAKWFKSRSAAVSYCIQFAKKHGSLQAKEEP